MQQHATVADLFSAATYAASPFIQARTAELKKRNDRELMLEADMFKVRWENKLRDTPYNGDFDGYLKELQAFSGQEFALALANQKHSSPYSQEKLLQMKEDMDIVAEGRAEIERDKWEYKRRDVEFYQAVEDYLDSGSLGLGEKAEKIAALFDGHKDVQRWDPGQIQENRELVYKAAFNKTLAAVEHAGDLDGAVKEVQAAFGNITGWKGFVEDGGLPQEGITNVVMTDKNGVLLKRGSPEWAAAMERFIKADEKNTKDENEKERKKAALDKIREGMREWTFPGRKEYEKKQEELAREKLWQKNMDKARRDEARWRRLLEEAAQEPGFEESDKLLTAADDIEKEYRNDDGTGVIDEITSGYFEGKAKDYAPGSHDELEMMFLSRRSRGGSGSGGGLSQTQMEKYMDAYADELYLAYFNGDKSMDGTNGAALRAAMPELTWNHMRNFYGYNGSFAQFQREHMPWFAKMYESMQKAAENKETKAMIPVLKKNFEKAIESSRDDEYKKLRGMLDNEYKGQRNIIVRELINDYVDLVMNYDWVNGGPQDAEAEMKKIVGAFTGKNLKLIRAAGKEGRYAVSGRNAERTAALREERLAEDLAAVYASPYLVTTLEGQGAVTWPSPDGKPGANEAGLEAIYTEARDTVAWSIAEGLGESPDAVKGKLTQVNKIDVKRDEEDPAAIYQYGTTGTFYRVRPEEDSSGKLTGKVIIEKQETANKTARELAEGKWEREEVNRRRGAESGIGAERDARAEAASERARGRDEAESAAKAARLLAISGKDDPASEAERNALLNELLNVMGGGIGADGLREAGIDPDTGRRMGGSR